MQSRTELETTELEILPLELPDLPDALALQKMAFMTEAIRYNDYHLSPLEERFAAFAQEFQVKTFLQARLEGAIIGLIRGFVADGAGFIERLSTLRTEVAALVRRSHVRSRPRWAALSSSCSPR